MNQSASSPLLDGIVAHARAEAEAILAQAAAESVQLEHVYQEKIHAAVEVEDRAADAQVAEILRREESAIRNAGRRAVLERQDRMWNNLLELLQQKMEALVSKPSYRDVLIGWIAEAAIGLDRSRALVSCSFKEHLDREMLQDAEQLIAETVGKRVDLVVSGISLASQGIEVRSEDGAVAYNNQVSTRILRYSRQLKQLMEGFA